MEELLVRVRSKGQHGVDRNIYKNDVDLQNPQLLSLILQDLKVMFNAPIEKAFNLMKKNEHSIFMP